MNFKEFATENQRVIEELGISKKESMTSFVNYEGKLMNSYETETKIISHFEKRGETTLMLADTGSGKTYSIINILKKNFGNYATTGYINIFVVPGRAQAEQISVEYNVPSLIGESEWVHNLSFIENNTICIIPDKAQAVYDQIKDINNCKINICIDEAHDICVEATSYRKEAIDSLNKLGALIRRKNSSFVYITATPDPLFSMQFENYLCFQNTRKFEVARTLRAVYLKKKDYKQQLAKYIERIVNQGFIPFVRYNNIKNIAIIVDWLKKRGYVVEYLDSSQKEAIRGENNKIVGYENPIYDALIRKSKLPGYNKEGLKIQVYLTTSLIEMGVNITGIIGKNKDEWKHLYPIFCIEKEHDASLSAAVQFINRVRYQVLKCAVVLPKPNPNLEQNFTNITDFFVSKYRRILIRRNKINNNIKQLKNGFISDSEIADIIENALEIKCVGNKKNDEGCLIRVENNRVEIDQSRFQLNTFRNFSKQYFYNPQKFLEDLESELQIPLARDYSVEYLNEEIELVDVNKEQLIDVCEGFKYCQEDEILRKVVLDRIGDCIVNVDGASVRIQKIIGNGQLDREEYFDLNNLQMKAFNDIDMMLRSKKGFIVKEIFDTNNKVDAFKILSKCDSDSKFKSLALELIIKKIVPNLSSKAKRALGQYLLGECSKEQLEKRLDNQQAGFVVEISESDYGDLIKQLLKSDKTVDVALNKIISLKTIRKIKSYIDLERYRKWNMLYLEGEMSAFTGIAGVEYLAIMKVLYEIYNENGNHIQVTLNEQALDYVCEKLTEAYKTAYKRDKPYKPSDVNALCKKIFVLRTKDNSIVRLRTKSA